jgi:hypothetical protein
MVWSTPGAKRRAAGTADVVGVVWAPAQSAVIAIHAATMTGVTTAKRNRAQGKSKESFEGHRIDKLLRDGAG